MLARVPLSACSWVLLSINSKGDNDMRTAIILGACILGLTACGSGDAGSKKGPSNATLKRACIDSGAFTMADDKQQICDCMLREIKTRKADASYILEHWQAQKNRTFGKSILPSSVDSGIQARCGGYQ